MNYGTWVQSLSFSLGIYTGFEMGASRMKHSISPTSIEIDLLTHLNVEVTLMFMGWSAKSNLVQ